jgi:hypothetical protein
MKPTIIAKSLLLSSDVNLVGAILRFFVAKFRVELVKTASGTRYDLKAQVELGRKYLRNWFFISLH